MFLSLLFTPPLFRSFSLLTKHKDFDFFKATLSTLNIIYIKIVKIKGSFGFTFEQRNHSNQQIYIHIHIYLYIHIYVYLEVY